MYLYVEKSESVRLSFAFRRIHFPYVSLLFLKVFVNCFRYISVTHQVDYIVGSDELIVGIK